MSELWEPLWQILVNLGLILGVLIDWTLRWWPALLWLAWWLWGADWRKVWPVLARGGWIGVILIAVLGAIVWAQIAPVPMDDASGWALGGFGGRLVEVSILLGLTLMAGWLQGVFHWQPPTTDALDEVADTGHHHETTHGHHHALGTDHS